MRFNVRVEHLFYAGFLILLLKQPLRYFLGPSYLAISLLGVVFSFLSLAANFRNLGFSKREGVIVFSFSLMALLDFLLLMVGGSGEVDRNLWFSGVSQLLASMLFLHYATSRSAWKFFKFSISIVLAIEFILAFLQISYYSTGVGLPPTFEDYSDFSFVSGSFANANDFAVFIAANCIALYSCWLLEGKDGRGYALLGICAMGVFVSLSRTVFLFTIFFIAFSLVRGGKKALKAPKKKANLVLLVAMLLIVMGFAVAVTTDFLVNTSVFERSIARIGQVGEITTDESSGARSLVYIRFLESLPYLGVGTFSDLNYSKFFQPGDFYLMTINPHSFLVEMSFLYGWAGCIAAIGLIAALMIGIMKNRDLPLYIRSVGALSLVFFQSVPSSILTSTSFFLPYLLLMCCRRRLLENLRGKEKEVGRA